MKDQIANILRNDADLVAFIGSAVRIWTKPLVRPGSTDPLDAGFDETPEAFETVAPFWLRRNIVVGSRIERVADRNRRTSDNLTARWGISLAYYVPSDGENDMPMMSYLATKALTSPSAIVTVPSGRTSRIQIPHDITATVPVPEFIDAGFVMIERVEVPTIWPVATLR